MKFTRRQIDRLFTRLHRYAQGNSQMEPIHLKIEGRTLVVTASEIACLRIHYYTKKGKVKFNPSAIFYLYTTRVRLNEAGEIE